jgi:1-acyl-sn-glycerol-3-phosphate acyltransferase
MEEENMASLWYRMLHPITVKTYFSRVEILNPEKAPAQGPVLYLGLHRNGAVDGFVYHSFFPRATFMISSQLRKNLLARLFFTGIEVVRSKDEGDRSSNADSMKKCLDLLKSGQSLFIFPEGTSTLGPRHLPFHSGAARLIAACLEQDIPLQVVPLGIHYDDPTRFRSGVEVVVGDAFAAAPYKSLPEKDRLKEIRKAVNGSLEKVGVDFENEESQALAQDLSNWAALETGSSYFRVLKALGNSIPENLRNLWNKLEEGFGGKSFHVYRNIPVFPDGSLFLSLLRSLFLVPWILIAGLLNFPVWMAALGAGRRLSDGPNVITLWRILVGGPLFLAWWLVLGAGAWACGNPLWWVGGLVLTALGVAAYDPFRRQGTAVLNGLFFKRFQQDAGALRQALVREFPGQAAKTLFLMPHEISFSALLAALFLGLGLMDGFGNPHTLLYLGLIALGLFLCLLSLRSPHWLFQRLRFAYYPLLMNVVYFDLGRTIPRLHPGSADGFLQNIDHSLVGENLSLRLQSLVHPLPTEVLSFCYFLFIPYLFFSMVEYLFVDLGVLRKFYVGLFTLYAMGFLGYWLIPAQGPYLAMAGEFHVPFTGWFFTHLNERMVAAGSNHVDVFPSLHCAISSYLLFFDREHRPWRFKLYLVPCLGLWASTIYLRYHYFIDVLAGFTLSYLALQLARRTGESQKGVPYGILA